MSRLIIKNLPKNIKEDRFRSIFAAKGELTDVKLCYTKDGKFRRYGFVGYKTDDLAKAALSYFNNSYIDTSKIFVDVAKNFGDLSLPRPWSKYSEGSSANKRLKEKQEKKAHGKKEQDSKSERTEDAKNEKITVGKEKKKKKTIKVLEELEDDVEFQDFLSIHKVKSSRKTKDDINAEGNDRESKKKRAREENVKVEYDDSDGSENEDEVYDPLGLGDQGSQNDNDKTEEENEEENKTARNSKLSDMDYLRSKVVSSSRKPHKKKKSRKDRDSDDDSINGESSDEGRVDVDTKESDDDDNDYEYDNDDGDDVHDDDDDDDDGDINDGDKGENSKESIKSGTIKMRGLPFKVKEKHIKDFFAPLRLLDIRMIENKEGKPTGCAFVDFGSENDIKEALTRDRDCIQGRYIELFRDKEKHSSQIVVKEKPWMKKLAGKEGEEEYESIAESGRLFLRNLTYSCSEEDLQSLFEEYGPLTETYLPLDKTTNKPTGIGFVTFVMPEHAVKAFNELDGKVFQGRYLHILPSKAKETKEGVEEIGTSFKSKRDAKKKSASSQDHNWNTLFLGMNAVADVMADKYNTTKGGILDGASSSSLAVRMALGETQVVTETRKFLVSQRVKLDVFGQPSAKRSKIVIVVKNLPFNTTTDELRTVFAPFGTVARLVLPPSGITALVEFFEPSQAKKAFQKLAYSKFKHVPLYLEWAPLGVFSGKAEEKDLQEAKKDEQIGKDKSKQTVEDKQEDEGDDPENAKGTTVFVKNLNFNTTEDALQKEICYLWAMVLLSTKIGLTLCKPLSNSRTHHLMTTLSNSRCRAGNPPIKYHNAKQLLQRSKTVLKYWCEMYLLKQQEKNSKNCLALSEKSKHFGFLKICRSLEHIEDLRLSTFSPNKMQNVPSNPCVAVRICTEGDWYSSGLRMRTV
ncbi:probable RNA-binding protein 19 isoform X2 [Porites lutea]|uniref:probable RNA-binding protein 19 isoform X2 n=1 Tax=Porites lutea TaxID=51062 RepID=UPI003CC62F83